MEGNEFIISEKLDITHLKSGDGSLVRGVVVRKNIRQGETLCSLPVIFLLMVKPIVNWTES